MGEAEKGIMFGLLITDKCIRNCNHCVSDSKPEGRNFPFSKLENVADQVKEAAEGTDNFYKNHYCITGGEPLLYSHNKHNLGDVVDLLHGKGAKINLITRGWTDKEKKRNSIIYRNFLALSRRKKKIQSLNVSFDTYTFNGNGDNEIALQMARNAINGFNKAGILHQIDVASSKERLERTYDAVITLMVSMGYKYYIDKLRVKSYNREKILNGIINYFNDKKRPIDILFSDENGERVIVSLGTITHNGREINLKETALNYTDHEKTDFCIFTKYYPRFIMINPDLKLRPECKGDFFKMPSIGSLKEKDLYSILKDYNKNSPNYEKMQDDFLKQNKFSNICEFCYENLTNYLPCFSFSK